MPSQSVPTQTAPCSLPASSAGCGKREATKRIGETVRPANSTGLALVEAQRAEDAQRLDEAVVEGDEEGRLAQPLAAEELRHELRLFVVDVPELAGGPTGAGKSNSRDTESASLRASAPSRNTHGGSRHSSIIVSGENEQANS